MPLMRRRPISLLAFCLAAAATWTLLGHAQQPRRFLYAAVPGVGNATNHGGVGILVFDIDKAYAFVKRIPTWTTEEGKPAEGVRGIAANAATGRLFVTTNRRLAAFDLVTDKVVWEQTYEQQCCDRMALSPDGKTLYVPAARAPKWYVVDAANGAVIKTIDKEGSPHNTIYSDDGAHAYLASQGRQPPFITVTDAKTHTVSRQIGPFGDVVRPFTINGRQTLVFANTNNLLGFEVADLTTGKVHPSSGRERDSGRQFAGARHAESWDCDDGGRDGDLGRGQHEPPAACVRRDRDATGAENHHQAA